MRHTTGHVLSAVHIAVHAPSSRTSLRAPSTFCARTPSAPSASPRMSLYRARHRARPRTCPPHSPPCRLPPPWRARCGACPPHRAQGRARLPLRPRSQARHCAPPQRRRARLRLRPRRRRMSHVPRVCCIAAHVPHGTRRRVHLRPGYTVGVPVLI
ncbi:hypothetical protein B0H14DRAFT_2872470, partial [Mycena olivaceomarginata]